MSGRRDEYECTWTEDKDEEEMEWLIDTSERPYYEERGHG